VEEEEKKEGEGVEGSRGGCRTFMREAGKKGKKREMKRRGRRGEKKEEEEEKKREKGSRGRGGASDIHERVVECSRGRGSGTR
jgi:hypothetical protein